MAKLYCGKIPDYDTDLCDHAPDRERFRVMVGGYYIPVCRNAYKWAKERGKTVSKGAGSGESVPFEEKIPAIRLNHGL